MSDSLTQLNEVTTTVNLMIEKMLSHQSEPRRLYDASKYLIQAGGKRLRPFLVLKSCELVNGDPDLALPVAVAIELIHNFTLIHDDIMDDDDKRRGVPTVHVLWGIPIAITAGDMLFAKAYEAILKYVDLSKVPPRGVLMVLEALTDATISICEGQALDILFEEKKNISEKEYFDMISKKTSQLLKLAAKVGAIVGEATPKQVRRLGNYGYYIGIAFQVIDDILGLTAEEEVLGKPVGSDIREGKKTIIIIHALSHANNTQRSHILSTLGNKTASDVRVKETTGIIKSLKSIDYAFKKASEFIDKAKLELSTFPSSPTKEVLLNLCDYIVSRSH